MATIKIVPMPGVPGPNGASAYQIAVTNGFEGTEQEWLDSLGNQNLTLIQSKRWGYPTTNAVAIVPTGVGESIALKSSGGAQLRWHIRDTGRSVTDYEVNILSIDDAGTDGSIVKFNIEPQDIPLPTGYYYGVNSVTGDSSYNGSYICTDSTQETITLDYISSTDSFTRTDFTGTLGLPSVYSQVQADSDGVWIKNDNWTEEPYNNVWWQFTKEGSIHFPYQTSNQRTGYGDVLKFASSFDQSIITGAPPTTGSPTANRLVVAGQDGVAGDGFDGEGGDIYLWAGRGGGTNGDGGDIKIDGGNGASNGAGGYVKIRSGYSANSSGGFVEISAGDSDTSNGGDISINAGYSNALDAGGNINIVTYSGGKITISGNGGEFIDDSSVPGNQIATISQLPTGATGSFTSQDGKTVTVTNGIITDIT